MNSKPLSHRIKQFSQGTSFVAVGSGVVILFGWILDLPHFKDISPRFPPMLPNTALAFIFGGLSLWLLGPEWLSKWRKRSGQLCAITVVAISLIGIFGYLANGVFLLDATLTPVRRPAVLTGFNLLFLGLSLLLMDVKMRGRDWPVELLAVVPVLVALLALIGYACNVPSFYGWRTLFPDAAMGLHTATMFALLGVGILAARADRALMKVIASDTSGGLVARRLLLAPVIIPLITGLLQISGRRTGLYNAEFASWFFAFLNIVVFTFVIWWIATLLYRMDESRRRAEESLRQKTVELQAANEELESFASSVAHDLHAPARHVAGFAQIVLEDHGREMGTAAQRHLGQIAEAAERMGHLISSLLAFSRLTRVDLRHTTVDLNTVVKNVLRQLEPDVQGRDTDIRVAPLPTVRADQTLITQVFANLIANALKYTRDRTPAVIEIGCHDGRPGHSVFFVRDNGAGFDMKHAGKLFRIFERLHSPDQFEGTGVGLSTVQRIIQRHGGQVWAEGEVDKGATFYFTLPTEPPSS